MRAAITRQHPAAFTVATPYYPTPPIQVWTCDDTLAELHGATPRTLPVRPTPTGVELTWSDYFAGAGGSSSGIAQVPGAGVKIAVNHWPLAIETHNFNHPATDHDTACLARTDPSRYPGTDLAWFSPECTYWSVARGDKCDYDDTAEQVALDVLDGDPDTPEAKEAKWRSRMLMRDVVRFSRHHRYKAVIVENVPDILKWAALDRWLAEMAAEGYRHKIITLNSAFAQATGLPAPQLRDRVYVVFWLARYRTPHWDKWLRPKGFCPGCGETVRAIYHPKPGKRRAMRYGRKAQYTYRCPKKTCRGEQVQPLVIPAAAAINWQLPAERIGDRRKPLATKTRARIAAGLARHCRQPILTPAGGTWNDEPTPVSGPMRTRTTRENEALVVPLEGRPGVFARCVGEPYRSQTTRHQDALVVPLRNHGNAEPASVPLRTVAAGGQHHALVMPYTAVTTEAEQSMGAWGHALYAYDTGRMRPLREPMPSQTTVEGDALLGTADDVDNCTLRMLDIDEIREAMAFTRGYVLLGSAKRDKVRMLGNAVTPPSARDLAACVQEAITGVDIALFELAA